VWVREGQWREAGREVGVRMCGGGAGAGEVGGREGVESWGGGKKKEREV